MKNATAARTASQPAAQPRILIGQDLETLQGTIHEMISFRAYELYEARGSEAGRELDDWAQAEQELCQAENVEVIDTGHEIRIRANLSTLNVPDVSVGISPQRVIILGEAPIGQPTREANTPSRRVALLQLIDLVPKVNPGKAVAQLSDGILQVTLPEAK